MSAMERGIQRNVVWTLSPLERGGVRLLQMCILLLLTLSTSASNISVITKLDTNQILIGDQVKLSLEVVRDKTTTLAFPEVGNSISVDSVRTIEVLASQIDTGVQSSGMAKDIITYTLTVFDSGYYVIPPLALKYKTAGSDSLRTILSEAMLLTVKSMEIDTAADIKPIKEPLTLPFQLREILVEIIIGGAILLAIAAVILYFNLRKKKPVLIKKFVRKEPAHETALNKLRALDEKKLWQQGEVKPYYSELSEVIREYLENRYGFPALESTTDEIMDRIMVSGISNKMREDLRVMLQTADLVKFAKALPLPDEHKKFMDTGVEFVKTTRTNEQAQNIEVMEQQP